MGYELNYHAASYPAGNESFSAVTAPRFIKLDSTSRAVSATASSKIEGVLMNCPPLGDVLTVAYAGIVKMPMAGIYAVGQYLTSGSDGLATACDASSTYARAILLEDVDATSDICAVRLIDAASYFI